MKKKHNRSRFQVNGSNLSGERLRGWKKKIGWLVSKVFINDYEPDAAKQDAGSCLASARDTSLDPVPFWQSRKNQPADQKPAARFAMQPGPLAKRFCGGIWGKTFEKVLPQKNYCNSNKLRAAPAASETAGAAAVKSVPQTLPQVVVYRPLRPVLTRAHVNEYPSSRGMTV